MHIHTPLPNTNLPLQHLRTARLPTNCESGNPPSRTSFTRKPSSSRNGRRVASTCHIDGCQPEKQQVTASPRSFVVTPHLAEPEIHSMSRRKHKASPCVLPCLYICPLNIFPRRMRKCPWAGSSRLPNTAGRQQSIDDCSRPWGPDRRSICHTTTPGP
ncbi:hypothetical protein K505DRAFT_47857 [Melanomma pulvis-pyrius CBS 109.77]|uniref:Uncharacterized protein n=1 Tax=Melanomma pulvis-pyrius CBS 109.77 TaxID=1314802 RepID=A0A6A6X9A6_9PLEO|nr:hypothetical protein K505DRAFT_47857 [Melanomma pulvis-pyrius CBS 109.77]